MNRLGVIRIVTPAAAFEIPYSEETAFTHTVVAVRSNGGFQNNELFIPYAAINFIVKVPDQTPVTSEYAGMTKQ